MPAMALLAAIVESSDDAIFGKTLEGTILSWSPAAERLYGYTAEQAIGRSVDMLVPPDRRAELKQILEHVGDGERIEHLETRRLRKDGAEVDVSLTVSPIHDSAGRVVGASSIARDIGERLRQQESYRHLFEGHPSPMWVFDLEMLRFRAVNDAAVAAYGWSRDEFLSMTIDEIRPVDEREAVRAHVRGLRGPNVAGIWTHLHKDGTRHDVAIASSPVEFDGRLSRLVLAQDVTELKHLERQLVQAQKAEAVGSLAAGVAHDFNNVLTVVRACAALLLKRLAGVEERRDVLQIDEAAQRGAELTHRLLAFSKEQVLRPELTDVNVVVHQTLALLERVLGDDVEIELELAEAPPPILVDRGQLGQVIVNLAVNARDAMPEGGTLAISTGVSSGEVRLQVSDTGIGMDEDTRERVFDPFFTTKETGTGLGLATVRGIVAQSGGRISLASEPGRGTTFDLSFPLAAAAPPVPAASADVEAEPSEGEETILFVEDEETVRVIVAETLRGLGYTVLEAGGGAEAIRLASEPARAIDLLLTDLSMPGMNGRDLAGRLTADRPGLRVVYTSGYPPEAADVDAGAAYLQKPYDSSELASAVRRLLDEPRAA